MGSKLWRHALLIVAALVLAPMGSAQALAIIEFSTAVPNTGSVSYAVEMGPLVGSDIQIADVVSVQSQIHSGESLLCLDCTLSFETGDLQSFTPGPTVDTWEFAGGPGSSLTIDGKVPDAGIVATAGLLEAAFEGNVVVSRFNAPGSGFAVQIGIHVGTVDGALAAYFGEAVTAVEQGGLNLSFFVDEVALDQTFTNATPASGPISAQVVPEPNTAVLLTLGLVALGLSNRAGRSKKR